MSRNVASLTIIAIIGLLGSYFVWLRGKYETKEVEPPPVFTIQSPKPSPQKSLDQATFSAKPKLATESAKSATPSVGKKK